MKNYIFLFDLDSTITKKEILPELSRSVGKWKEMRDLTEKTMRGELPFKTSFLDRVKLLSEIPINEVQDIIANIPLNESLVDFITQNKHSCYIVTGNLDVWIKKLLEKIDMKDHCFCSKAIVRNNKLRSVVSVLDKELTIQQFVQPLVVVGDGDNDAGMARYAEVAIGFGGVRPIAPSLLRTIHFAFYDERKCSDFLLKLQRSDYSTDYENK